MKSLRPKQIVVLVVTLTIGQLLSVEGRGPVLHRVGGGQRSWEPSTNFSDWSSREVFYVGDWLYFGFDKSVHNVLEVNQTSYQNCVEAGYITNITRGGRDVFNLNELRDYYFICGRGFCSQGMKVKVSVQQISPAPELPPHGNSMVNNGSSSHYDKGFDEHVIFVSITATLALLYHLFSPKH